MAANEVIRKQIDAVNRHDITAFTACYSPNAVVMDPQYPEPLRGGGAIGKDMTDFLTALPDLELRLKRTITEGDSYAAEITMSGTHKGPLIGPSGQIPATNKRVEIGAILLVQLDKDGRIAEEHRYYDLAGMMSQLGLMA